jgi:shikimate dehydrogenase
MSQVNGETTILGLIGNNTLHSKSFALHNFVIEKQALNAIYIPLQTSNFLDCLKGLSSINCFGANITIPFKEVALKHIDTYSEEVRKIQSINTIVRVDGQWVGHNTDHYGFWKSLEEKGISLSSRPVYLWGAGGAAKAVCYALKQQNVTTINCWNRTASRIKTLERIIDVQYYDWTTPLPSYAILINCTPISRWEDLPKSLSFNQTHVVVDLIYWKTPLLQYAESKKAICLDGSGMLIHQAAKAFSLWFPNSDPTEYMKQIYQEKFL